MNLRSKFPFFEYNKDTVYLDSAASSLKLNSVIDSISNYYKTNGTNVFRGVYNLSHEATKLFEETRLNVSKLINSDFNEVIFTKGTTDSLNSLAKSLDHLINEGDEIITSELEHHSSLLPWQIIARKKNARLVYVKLDENGKITTENFKKALSSKTKIVALNHISNSLGFISPIKEITKLAKENNKNTIVIIDAAQSASHIKIDVKDLNVDFLAFSAHKMYGPNGVGVLYGKAEILKQIPPFEYGGEMAEIVLKESFTYKDIPYKFEAGTPNVAGVIGFNQAIKFLLENDLEKIHNFEMKLRNYALNKMKEIKEVTIYNESSDSAIITFNVLNMHPHDIASVLDDKNICVRAGHHCAQLINQKLKVISTLRISFGVYNNFDDIDKFIEALKDTILFFKEFGV